MAKSSPQRQSDPVMQSQQMRDNGYPFPSLLEECWMILRVTSVSLALIAGAVGYFLALFDTRATEASAVGVGLLLFIAYLARRAMPAQRLRPDITVKAE